MTHAPDEQWALLQNSWEEAKPSVMEFIADPDGKQEPAQVLTDRVQLLEQVSLGGWL